MWIVAAVACASCREILRAEAQVRPLLVQLAARDEAVPQRVRHAAIRALASLGAHPVAVVPQRGRC